MVIISEETNSIRSADPLVLLQLSEFEKLTERMRRLDIEKLPAEQKDAKLFAMNLCDASRELVFRLHRITRVQLQTLIAVFEEAAKIIDSWPLSALPEKDRLSVQNYGRHILGRAETLRKHLQPTTE